MTLYLDYNSTTHCDERILPKVVPWFSNKCGNPSSREHPFGWHAAQAVEDARLKVAELINACPREIVFTSGATESINAVFRSLELALPVGHIVTCSTEHDAVLSCCRAVERASGRKSHYLSVDSNGSIDCDKVMSAISDSDCAFVSLMLANNEVGTIHAMHHLSDCEPREGGFVFADITQAVGKIPVNVRELGIDMAAFSSHKIYGPMGVGALYVRGGQPEIKLQPLIVGGGQERGLRGGTLNVPGIVGFGEACRIAKEEMESDNQRIVKLRDRLETTLLCELADIWINGAGAERLCNTSNIGFRGVDARTMIRDMHDIACSTKSACSSGDSGPSHVLKAIGLTDDEAYSCIRFSLGRFTTDQEIDYALEKIIGTVRKLR